jgi:crotonobetainyl-CoA:carnitine CoA-transferase CaiB-like acyl-CoA transferase
MTGAGGAGGPLDGVRVVEMAAVLTGPYAAMFLADQGADVVKVEQPGLGDVLRSPTFCAAPGITAFFVNSNRGKRSIVIDVAVEQGQAIVRQLFKTADVFIQNYRPGVVDRLGLGYPDAKRCNPEIIYISISGYGDSGPYRDRRVYDPIIQGLTGHVGAQINPDIPIPDLVRNVVADKATALMAAQAATAALFARSQGRGGQHIQIPMIDASLAFFWPDGMMAHTWLGDNPPPGRALYEIYHLTETADGHLIYFTVGDREMQALLRALDRLDVMEDERFATIASRIEHWVELGDLLAATFRKWPTKEILARLGDANVAAGPVLSLDEVLLDPQLTHNEAIRERVHPTGGPLREVRHPIRFEGTPPQTADLAPTHGQHTDEVLAELGYDNEAISELHQNKTVS